MKRLVPLLLACLLAAPASAKPARHKTTARRAAPAPKRAPAHPVAAPAAPAESDSTGETATVSGDEAAGGEASASGVAPGTKIKTKTYTFGAMDVEGKLKTPQLLYFLNRVKLELDMSAPDKR
ncbi:MAG TPA: hypothetical protein VN962_01355 [Polyangia bacterium]|nr:hypothetical protein [Polyangia bacterium]